MNNTIGSLLSAVSLLLAAFGFVYNTQKDRIDEVLADTDIPEDATARVNVRKKAKAARNSAAWLCLTAFVMWLLLLKEIEHKFAAAIHHHFAFSTYSTLDVVFFVAANTWLLIAIFLGCRVQGLNKRANNLKPPK